MIRIVQMMSASLGDCTIRSVPAADLDSVNTLLLQAGLPALTAAPGIQLNVWGARVAAGLVGSAALEVHGGHGLLRSLVVIPAVRGRGIGAQLVARAEKQARRSGLQGLYLLTDTAPDFFRRLGYQAVQRASTPAEIRASEEFSRLCPVSAECFRKELRR